MNGRWKHPINALLWVLLLLVMVPTAQAAWVTKLVDNSSVNGQYVSMAVDSAGKLHLGYMDNNGTLFLKYATNATGANWDNFTTESLRAYMPGVALTGTATVSTPGGPRIMAYSSNPSTGEFKYQALRKVVGDGWQLQDIAGGKFPDGTDQPIVDSAPSTTQTGAVQSEGFTFITYSDGNNLWYANERDYYANYIDAYYKFETSGSGNQSDLAIDSLGHAHILYYNPTTLKLMYAVDRQEVPDTLVSAAVTNPCIAVGPDDTIHVAYVDTVNYGTNATTKKIHYLRKSPGGGWTEETIGTSGVYAGNSTTSGYLVMKVDSAGGVHLAWCYDTSTTKDVLRYINRAPGVAVSWAATYETVPYINTSYEYYGRYAAMVIDKDNNVYIAHYSYEATALCLSRKTVPAINVAPEPVYYGNVQLGQASTQRVTVTNSGSANLVLASSNAVVKEGTDASLFTILGTTTCADSLSLAPNASCYVDIQYAPTSPGSKLAELKIASNDPVYSSKSVELRGMSYYPADSFTIDVSAGIGGSISPGGTNGVVNVVGGSNQTFTMNPDPGYIVYQVVVDGQYKGNLTSFEFTEVANNHTISVMFMPVTPVATWDIDEVDNTSTTGKYCSIANDPTGKLHVGYIEETTPRKLKYATNKSGSWVWEQVTVIPDIISAGTATVFSEGIGPRVMAYAYNSTTGIRKYGAARKWTEVAPAGGNLNDWQLQYIAGDFWDPPANTMPQLPIYNTTSDTFTGATQFGGKTFITYTDGNNLWYANERDYYYHKLDPAHSIAGAGKQSDLVLDTDGNIHIAYITPATDGFGELRYGTGQGNSEQGYTETVLVDATVANTISDPSITLDGNRMVHVSYIHSGRVKYLNKPLGGSWSSPYDVGPCGTDGKYTSIKANGLNIVHLAYYSDTGSKKGSVMYAQRSAAGAWSIPMPVWMEGDTATTDYGSYAAMAVDDHHNVSIAYYDISRTALKVARKNIPVVMTSSDALLYNDVAIGAQASQTVTVTNAGLTDLTMGTAVITGADAADFAITGGSCTVGTIVTPEVEPPVPSGNCTITVTFTRATSGDKSAVLHISSSDHYVPDKQVVLTAASGAALNTITASAADHGAISPSGVVSVVTGADQCFTMTPAPGFYITDLLVDGLSVGGQPYYCFDNVTANHTIQAFFSSYVKVGDIFFGTLQDAYNASGVGAPIKARATSFSESLSCDMPKETLFAGGFDYLFTSQTGATVLRGNMEVSSGGIEVQNLGFE